MATNIPYDMFEKLIREGNANSYMFKPTAYASNPNRLYRMQTAKIPFSTDVRNKALGVKSKLQGSQVPVLYDPKVASRSKLINDYENANYPLVNQVLASAPDPRSIKGFYSSKIAPNFGWNKSTGLKMFGKDLGGWTGLSTLGVGAIQGAQALGTLNELKDAGKSTEELLNDIVISANSNPIVNSYLTSDQKSLLRKAKRGDISAGETSLGDLVPNDLNDVLNIGKGVLMGLPGGIPGMIVGGVGSALNSGLEGNLQDTNLQNTELEALLQALEDAEMQYQSMKRPNFTGLGIQQRYQDMYM